MIPASLSCRPEFCRLLAAAFYQPEEMFREEEVFPRLQALAEAIDPALATSAERLAGGFAAGELTALLLDYTRLFLGPFDILAKPYGSVWLEGEKVLLGDSTLAVSALYREGGFDLAEDFREVPDHVAVELEFLYLLLFREGEARTSGDQRECERLVDLKQRFLTGHLGRWFRPFAGAVKAGAQSDFYRELVETAEIFLALEMSPRAAEVRSARLRPKGDRGD